MELPPAVASPRGRSTFERSWSRSEASASGYRSYASSSSEGSGSTKDSTTKTKGARSPTTKRHNSKTTPQEPADALSSMLDLKAATKDFFSVDGSCFAYETGSLSQTALLPRNVTKNRHGNVVPYDVTRVLLQEESGTDYINASYISGFCGLHTYIATQAPLSHTRADFWQMVWDTNCDTIVMMCSEDEVSDCQYWPADFGAVQYGACTIVHLATESLPEECCVVRTFRLERQQPTFLTPPASLLSAFSPSSSPFTAPLGSPRGLPRPVSPRLVSPRAASPPVAASRSPSLHPHSQPSSPQHSPQLLLSRSPSFMRLPTLAQSPSLSSFVLDADPEAINTYSKSRSTLSLAAATTSTLAPSRIVKHYHYRGWPDSGAVPDSTAPLAALARRLHSLRPPHEARPPIVIHCTVGAGRTGSFCVVSEEVHAVDTLATAQNAALYPTRERACTALLQQIDLRNMTKAMRMQRPGMVATAEQYLFCLAVVQDELIRHGLVPPSALPALQAKRALYHLPPPPTISAV
eukprot:TRINITY_DN10595_c1_g1_i1.p1 TRINITY_DN10595_c1_g1~~TRINITY_DN10595_c1_g1_i1.p1  ORF type:complete len:608 (+),score=146.10 TRINITY_DN10595_c1_g1_i1:264-1826(+)